MMAQTLRGSSLGLVAHAHLPAMTAAASRLPTGRLAAFTAPCLPLAAVGLPLVVYLPPYYADTLGLPLATVGLIFLVVRLVDLPLEPLIGHWIDCTRSRFGRFRLWMVLGATVMIAGLFAVFMARPGLSASAAFAGLLVFYIGYSMTLVSHTAWGALLSDDYHERSRIFGWWQFANLLGLLSILAVPPLAQRLVPGGGAAVGVEAMGWTLIALLPLTVAWNVAAVPERAALAGQHARLRDILAVARAPLMRRLLLVDLLSNLGPGVAGALLLFFFEAAKGYPREQASMLLLSYFAAGLLGAPLWVRFAKATSKHHAVLCALVAYAVLQTGTMLLPGNNFPLAALGMALAGVPAVAPLFLQRAMLADLSDAETLRTGQERTGLFYAALAAVQKLGYAIPVGLTYPILAAIGFDPALGARNGAAAIDGLVALFVIPPAVLALAAAAVVRGWPIDATAQARTAAALGAP